MVGLSRGTLRKVRAVMAAAASDPQTFGPLQAEMDRTGKASGPHAKLQSLKDRTVSPPKADPEKEFFQVISSSLERLAALQRQNPPLSERVRTALKALARIINESLRDGEQSRPPS